MKRMTRRYWETATCLSKKIEARYATTKDSRNILKRLFSLHNSKHCQLFCCCSGGFRSSLIVMFEERLITPSAVVVCACHPWDEGRDSDHVTGLNWDNWLAGHRKIPAGNGPSYHAVGVRGRLRFDRSLPRRG